ncbi:MAG: AAA family ATPase [Anaerolineae bacterium]|nr:AAA family ATPase [Anaerolineae bacterium]
MTSDELNVLNPLTGREQQILALIALGLSNREIAEELVVATETVRWYTKQIYSKMGVSGRVQAIQRGRELGLLGDNAPAHSQAPAPSRSLRVRPLPASVARFVGRAHEIEQASQLLRDSRLLTLTGPGGTGKTQLSLKIASEAQADFKDGAYFVNLAPISDSAQVIHEIADALGVVEAGGDETLETMVRAIADQELLLLIDNFEHVIDAAPIVTALLAGAPRLKILVTSREALHISGEQEFAVPPLSLPADDTPLERLDESEAVALFVQRLRMIQPDFELTDDTAPAIVEICKRLDGLPLAIELAAARCKLLSPQTLLARISNSLDALTGGPRDVPLRQQTLRATMEWSHKLLDPGEQMLFARLGPFRGGRSLEAIEAICTEGLPIDLYDGLESLLDKSLIQQRETIHGEPRFYMLATIQDYAREQLEASGEADTIRRRHAEYFADLAERANPELRMAHHRYWSQVLEIELGNLRMALDWSLNGGDPVIGARLAGGLDIFWYWYGYHVEGLQWMTRLLERLGDQTSRHYVRLLYGAGLLETVRDIQRAEQYQMKALAAARNLDDKFMLAWVLTFSGYARLRDKAVALEAAEEGLAHFRELEYKPGIAQALNILGEITRFHGDDLQAQVYYEEALQISRQTGETRRIIMMMKNLAYLAQHRGDHDDALTQLHEALQMSRDFGSRLDMATGLVPLAGSLGLSGEPERAVRLFAASQAALEKMGAFHQQADQPEVKRNIAAVRARLSEEAFAAAWAQGRTIALEDALADALDEAPAG